MFAIMKTGGKQYRVQPGDVLRVEKLVGNPGETVQFNEVLAVGDQFGAPLVDGAYVQAEVVDQIKADKVITFHKRRRKHSSQRTRGHRQQLTLLRVTGIMGAGAADTGVTAATGTRAARRAAANGSAGATGAVRYGAATGALPVSGAGAEFDTPAFAAATVGEA